MKKIALLLLLLISVLLYSCKDTNKSVKVSGEKTKLTQRVNQTTLEKAVNQVQPKNGTIITGEELIITWPVIVDQADKIIVRFRKSENEDWQKLEIKDGFAKVKDLEKGKNFQYQLVAHLDSKTIESTINTVSFQKGVKFEEHDYSFSIDREYQVRRSVKVINPTDISQKFVLSVENNTSGLITGFVGSGSSDLSLEIPAGKTLPVALLFFAQDAKSGNHTCVIRMQVIDSTPLLMDNAIATITVVKPKFDLSTSFASVDPLTLTTELRIVNKGDVLTDFDIVPVGENANRVRCNPKITHAELLKGDILSCQLQPILKVGEKEFTCEIELRAAGQSKRIPVVFKVPEDKQVFVALTRSTITSENSSWYCTNHPEIGSDMQGSGNGPNGNSNDENSIDGNEPDDNLDIPLGVEQDNGIPYEPSILEQISNKLEKFININHDSSPNDAFGIRGDIIRTQVAKHYLDLEKDNLTTAPFVIGKSTPKEVAISWHHYTENGNQEVSYASISEEGEIEGPINISKASGNSSWPTIKGNIDKTMLICWEDDRDGKEMELYLSRSTNKGKTWSDPMQLTQHGSGAFDPILWQQDKTWLLAWEDARGGIYTKRSDDDGKTWQEEILLAKGKNAWPQLVGNKDKIWCIWRDATTVKITHSVDLGSSWSEATQLSNNEKLAGEPTIATDGTNVYTAWRSEKEGNSEIMFRAQIDDTWSDSVQITDDSVMSEYPSISINNSKLTLGYISTDLGHASGYARISNDKGKTWEPVYRLPRLNPNLNQALLVVKFGLPWNRSTYKKHSLDIFVNKHKIAELIDVIPEGTYVFPVHPKFLHYTPGGISNNKIQVVTKHLNGGHYVVAADFKMIHFVEHQELLVIASSQEEADKLAQQKFDFFVNHDRPDVAIFSNLITDLPENLDKEQTISLKVKVSNVGPVTLNGGKLECVQLTDDAEIAISEPVVFKSISAGRCLSVPVSFKHDGKPKRVAIRVIPDGPDADLSNNVHILRIGMLDQGYLKLISESSMDYSITTPLNGEEIAKGKANDILKIPTGVYNLMDVKGELILPNIAIKGGETTIADPSNTGIVEVRAYKDVDFTFTSSEGKTITGKSNKDLRLPTGFYTVKTKGFTIPDLVIRRGKHIIVEAIAKGKIDVNYIQHGTVVWVTDIHGNKVASGWTNGSAGGIPAIPPGTYTVATDIAQMENVAVRSGETTTIDLNGIGRLSVEMELDGKPAGKNTQYFVMNKKGERISLNYLRKEVILPIGNSYTVTCMDNKWENVKINEDELTNLQVYDYGQISVWPGYNNYFYTVYDMDEKEVTSYYTQYTRFLKTGTYNVIIAKDYKVLQKTKVTIHENKTSVIERKE